MARRVVENFRTALRQRTAGKARSRQFRPIGDTKGASLAPKAL